ncbi:MAG: FHA domain-containing protein [Elusimicrobiota bacterium]
MTKDQENRCHVIIHSAAASTATIGAGLAQIPGSDNLLIVPIQIGMIESLAGIFGIHVGEATIKGILASAIATVGGRTISQWLVGWIPGIGNVINATTAAAITEGIGWFAANDFASRAPVINKINFTSNQEVITENYLKDYDKELTGLIKNKTIVNETQMTNLLTGRLKHPGITGVTAICTGKLGVSSPHLIIFDDDGNSKRFKLQNEKTFIGRSDSESKDIDINLFRFDPEKRVSRKHAIIYEKTPEEYYIEDNGSTNGTQVNKKELSKNNPIQLNNGDEIIFGKTKVFFNKS